MRSGRNLHTFVISRVTECSYSLFVFAVIFFFQAEDGIRDLVRSRGLGDVYKRQVLPAQPPARTLCEAVR